MFLRCPIKPVFGHFTHLIWQRRRAILHQKSKRSIQECGVSSIIRLITFANHAHFTSKLILVASKTFVCSNLSGRRFAHFGHALSVPSSQLSTISLFSDWYTLVSTDWIHELFDFNAKAIFAIKETFPIKSYKHLGIHVSALLWKHATCNNQCIKLVFMTCRCWTGLLDCMKGNCSGVNNWWTRTWNALKRLSAAPMRPHWIVQNAQILRSLLLRCAHLWPGLILTGTWLVIYILRHILAPWPNSAATHATFEFVYFVREGHGDIKRSTWILLCAMYGSNESAAVTRLMVDDIMTIPKCFIIDRIQQSVRSVLTITYLGTYHGMADNGIRFLWPLSLWTKCIPIDKRQFSKPVDDSESRVNARRCNISSAIFRCSVLQYTHRFDYW